MTFPPLAQIAGYEYRVNGGPAVDVGADLNALAVGLRSGSDQRGRVRAYDNYKRRGKWSRPAIAETFALMDDFNDNSIDPAKWGDPFYSGSNVTVVEESGKLRIRQGLWVGNSSGGIRSRNVINFRGKRLEVDVPAMMGPTSGGSVLGLYDGHGGGAQATIIWDGAYYCYYGGASPGVVSVAGVTKWAIQHHADTSKFEFFFYIGGAWVSQFLSPVATWVPDLVQLSIAGYTYGGGTQNTSFDVDNLVVR